MKTKLLVAGALLFTASAFAQTTENTKNKQGTSVSTVAKSQTEAGTKGTAVSTTATSKSQASLHRKNQTVDERKQSKIDRKAARETRMQEHKDFIAGTKSENEARKDEHSANIKTENGARKELLNEYKDQAKERKEGVKAERKISDDGVLKADAKSKASHETADGETRKVNHPMKVKGGAKTGADVKLRRPNVGAKVHGAAGLGHGKH